MVRERIIMQASDFFSLYGIKNISMDALASSLGISKRTIYEHFKNKEEILKIASLLLKRAESVKWLKSCGNRRM